MKNVISKIFSGEIDENVHNDFVKFGKGKFENKYLIEGKKQTGKWSIKTSAEFANYFVKNCLEDAEEISVKGAIISTLNIEEDIDFEIVGKKNYMGIKQLLINGVIESRKIIDLMEKYPRVFFALSFKTDKHELKIKPKAPKSGKPSAKGESGPKADFCSLKTSDESIVKDLFFDFPDFKEIKIKHVIEIKEIEIPSDVKDPVEMREKAIRKGILKRIVEVDGVEKESEKEFSV